MKKRIKDPATANEYTSIPINSNKLCPKKRNTIIITPAISVALSD